MTDAPRTDGIKPDRSFGTLLTELSRETALLFRQEIALAKAELVEKVAQAGSGAVELVVGGIILLLSLEALLAAAIIGLAQSIGYWQSALVLGIAVLLLGTAVLMRGLAVLRAESLAPKKTIASLRETTAWARDQAPRERTL